MNSCTPFANTSAAEAHCAAQPADHQCVVSEDDRTAGTRRSRRLSERVFSFLYSSDGYATCQAAGLSSVGQADCALASTYLGISHAGILTVAPHIGPYLAPGCVRRPWDTYTRYNVGASGDCTTSGNTCLCEESTTPAPSPPPPPALHALVHHDDFQNGLRFNENVDRTIYLSTDSGLAAGDAVVYVPVAESSCANVLTLASDNKHGGLLSADAAGELSAVVNLPRGAYHACVAQQSSRRARKLQATGSFGVSDFTLRTDVTLTADPVDGEFFACTCPMQPPSAPPSRPPPLLPPPPSPPP